MFKRIRIDNFKSFSDFSISLTNMTVIVGNNSAGKSAFLQAIDFMCSFVKEDFSVFLDRNQLKVENIRNRFDKSTKMVFDAEIVLDIEGIPVNYSWHVVLKMLVGSNEIFLSEEMVSVADEFLLSYKEGKWLRYRAYNSEIAGMAEDIRFYSSCMKHIKRERADKRLASLAEFLGNSESFAMLLPADMRQSSRKKDYSIGMSGRNLSSFIKRMSEDARAHYISNVKTLLGDVIEDVSTRMTGRPGWVQLEVTEEYGGRSYKFNAREVSDGLLRLLAFLAIMEIDRGKATYLLDEVENGINTDLSETLMSMFTDVCGKHGIQFILTTHSTVFLDYVNTDSIIILYRDRNSGNTKSVRFDDIHCIIDKLDYMYPGEIVLNQSIKGIVEAVMKGELSD